LLDHEHSANVGVCLLVHTGPLLTACASLSSPQCLPALPMIRNSSHCRRGACRAWLDHEHPAIVGVCLLVITTVPARADSRVLPHRIAHEFGYVQIRQTAPASFSQAATSPLHVGSLHALHPLALCPLALHPLALHPYLEIHPASDYTCFILTGHDKPRIHTLTIQAAT
jgi:hypothetical protein